MGHEAMRPVVDVAIVYGVLTRPGIGSTLELTSVLFAVFQWRAQPIPL